MIKLSYILIQLLLMLGLAPLLNGLILKLKAYSQKRKGPPLLQPYYDLYKLFRKDTVISKTASWVYTATPYITLSTVLLACLFIPATPYFHPLSFSGDIIFAVYLLALSRFFMALAALDTGSTFGGMGSSREMMIATLMEPALLVTVITLGLVGGSLSVYQMMTINNVGGLFFFQPVHLLLFASIFIILLAETSRIPIDDPATHLELTMVHEAMVLEYSGHHLAMMELAACVKQLFFLTLLANLFFPVTLGISTSTPVITLVLGLLFYVFKVLILTVALAIVEIMTVKLRFFSVPNLASLSFALAFLGFVQYFVIGR